MYKVHKMYKVYKINKVYRIVKINKDKNSKYKIDKIKYNN